MLIITVKDNKHNGWKRNAKTKKKHKKTTKKEKTKQNKKNNRIRGEGSYGERMRDK